MLGVVRAADGWVGINCLTGQHWLDVCAMLGLPEFGEQQFAIMMGGPERGEFFAAAQPWLSERTVAEIVELSQALRIPAAPVADGASALECPQYAKRGFFVDGGTDGLVFSTSGAAVSSLEDTGGCPPVARRVWVTCRRAVTGREDRPTRSRIRPCRSPD